MMNLICNDPNSDEVLIYKDGPFRFNSTGDPGHLQKDFTFTVPENASVGTAEFSVTYYPPAQPIPRQVSLLILISYAGRIILNLYFR